MKTPQTTSSPSKLSRRTLFAGASAAGAMAAVAGLLSTQRSAQDDLGSRVTEAPESGGGYRLSEHIKRYYQTTRL
jgi:hypothetical protein